MLTTDGAIELVKRAQTQVRAANHSALRRELDLRLSYYEGDQLDDLQKTISDRYKITSPEVCKFSEIYNLTREVIDARAKAYWRAPTRNLLTALGEEVSPAQQKVWDDLVKAGELDAKGKMIDRYTLLWNSCIVWPRYRELGSRKWIKWELFGPQSLWVVQDHDNPDELAASEAVVILLAARTETMEAEKSRFALWTQTDYGEFVGTIEGGFPQFDGWVPGRDPKPHKLSRIPLTVYYSTIPMGELWPTKGNELILANRAINFKKTDLAYLMAMQSHGQLVVYTDNDKTEVAVGPDVVIKVDPVDGGRAEYIQPGAELEAVRKIIEWTLKSAASNENLSPNRLNTDERAALSGVAKLIDEIGLVEDVDERQGLYQRPEADLFDASREVWNAHNGSGSKIPTDAMQTVGFVPFTFPVDPLKEMETTERKIQLGAIPAWRATQIEKPALTDKEAAEEWSDNLALLQQRTVATSPPSAAPRRLFGAKPPTAKEPPAPPAPDAPEPPK
jgi:hypothetical protein